MTKKIMFQGSEYVVSDWAKWLAKDADGVIYAYEEEPKEQSDSYWCSSGYGNCRRVGHINCLEICDD